MIHVGIDYSISCPAICIHTNFKDKNFNVKNCRFFYLTSVKKFGLEFNKQISGEMHKEYSSDEQRWNNISAWAINKIFTKELLEKDATGTTVETCPFIKIGLEGYSFGSRGGLAFTIAENTHALKHKFWQLDKPFELYPPSMVKKFATNKGNAKKEAMYEQFIKDTELNLESITGSTRDKSPISDIVDSYFICKLIHQNTL